MRIILPTKADKNSTVTMELSVYNAMHIAGIIAMHGMVHPDEITASALQEFLYQLATKTTDDQVEEVFATDAVHELISNIN